MEVHHTFNELFVILERVQRSSEVSRKEEDVSKEFKRVGHLADRAV